MWIIFIVAVVFSLFLGICAGGSILMICVRKESGKILSNGERFTYESKAEVLANDENTVSSDDVDSFIEGLQEAQAKEDERLPMEDPLHNIEHEDDCQCTICRHGRITRKKFGE